MEIIVEYPSTEEERKIFVDNLTIFKAMLLYNKVRSLNIKEKIKEDVLNKVIELLKERDQNSEI